MPTPSEAVREFHKKFNIPSLDINDEEDIIFRIRLIYEEFDEVLNAAGFQLYNDPHDDGIMMVPIDVPPEPEPVELLKELADLVYVIYGAAETFGLNLDEAFNRVHASNMSKLGEDGKPIYREDGKVLKGPNYKEPYLGDLV